MAIWGGSLERSMIVLYNRCDEPKTDEELKELFWGLIKQNGAFIYAHSFEEDIPKHNYFLACVHSNKIKEVRLVKEPLKSELKNEIAEWNNSLTTTKNFP